MTGNESTLHCEISHAMGLLTLNKVSLRCNDALRVWMFICWCLFVKAQVLDISYNIPRYTC